MVAAAGFEPAPRVCEPDALPLSYAAKMKSPDRENRIGAGLLASAMVTSSYT